MANENYNIIKPVDGLPNIPGLDHVKRRKQRKRRPDQNAPHKQDPEEPDESYEEPTTAEQSDLNTRNQHGQSEGIDYRA